MWKKRNPVEYDYVVDFQRSAALEGSSQPESEGDFIEAPAAENTAAQQTKT